MAWRNIADAQAKKEGEKRDATRAKSKGSIFASLFGGPPAEGKRGEEEPPISLTLNELKELESFTTAQATDSELSSDS